MSEKPYYELPAPREVLDDLSKKSGHPDNAIEDATGTIKGIAEPESAMVGDFFTAAQALLDPSKAASSGKAQGGDVGASPASSTPAPSTPKSY
jgi:hypothetical protein